MATYKEDDVEPLVEESELKVAENLRDDGAVLGRHVHPHQYHHRDKVHSLLGVSCMHTTGDNVP